MARGTSRVSIVGATGLVGSEIARILIRRMFPLDQLCLFSSGRSREKETVVAGQAFAIRPFSLDALGGSGICFLAAGGEFARRYARQIAARGLVVIDNSSAFRMDSDVPLVVPEVNPGDLAGHRGIIANPNCSTIQMVVVLAPLARRWGLRKVVVSTYQAVSGAGLAATGELATHSQARLEGRDLAPRAFLHNIAFNVIPRIDSFDAEGWTGEERKMINETRKILGDESIEVLATTVRVPVFRGHSESVYAQFAQDLNLGEVRKVLENSPGVRVVDDPSRNLYPMPIDCVGKEDTLVGRLRMDPASSRGLCMWIVSDNVWKGGALNAVQIAELLL